MSISFNYLRGYVIPIIDLVFTTVPGEERTLNVEWLPEMAQDIDTFNGIDYEEELINIMTYQISQEINDNLMNQLIEDASTPVFPIISQIFTNTIAHDMVTIQPLDMPVGLTFYMDFKYKNKIERFKYLR